MDRFDCMKFVVINGNASPFRNTGNKYANEVFQVEAGV